MTGERHRHATMLDVAQRAGVSRSLVSTVFRGVPGASQATRARVMDAAAELGYRPDVRAQQLRSRGSNIIGVTLTATQTFHVGFVEALADAADLRGYELSITLSTPTRTLDRAVDTLLAQRCAALVLIGPKVPDEQIAAVAVEAGAVPVLTVDQYVDLPSIDALRVDDAAALSQLVGHLVDLGHADIWHVGGGDYCSAVPRRAAYESAMAQYGISEHARVVDSGGAARDGAAAAMEIIAAGTLPTAITAYNDRVACGVIDVLWRHRIRVPEDISIVGFDNIPEASMPHMDFTTIEQRVEDLAAAVVEVLLHRLAGGAPAGLHLMPPGPLILRSSTAPPRREAKQSAPIG